MSETRSYRVTEQATLVFHKQRYEPGDEFTTDEDREWWLKYGFLEEIGTTKVAAAAAGGATGGLKGGAKPVDGPTDAEIPMPESLLDRG